MAVAMSVNYYTVNGMILAEDRGGVYSEFVPDTLGSCVAVKDASETITYTADYWPYGEVRTSTGSKTAPWGFVGLLGYLTDIAKRLYVRARHYRPNVGQWQTVDPLWPSEMAYVYVNGKPVTSTDSSGLLDLDEFLCCLKFVALEGVLGCLAGVGSACIGCIIFAIGLCIGTSGGGCSLLGLCAAECGGLVTNCVIGALLGGLGALTNCIWSGTCGTKPEPEPDCFLLCANVPPGLDHMNCLRKCRGIPVLPKPRPMPVIGPCYDA